MKLLIPTETIQKRIFRIRGHKVMLDEDLAKVYGVTTTRLNQQVKRNSKRFPRDFMFKLTPKETQFLMLHFATSNTSRGGRRKPPNVFTEHGAIMLASVLSTPIAVQASVEIARAFVKLREMVSSHKKLAKKLSELERHIKDHDAHIETLFEAIYDLMKPEKIGFLK